MGQFDRNLVLKFIIEAEEAGILGGGCAEMFEETNAIWADMNMLSGTIVDLYSRQIAMDGQIQKLLHYQKVMSFVNAILSCIPLAGGVAAHLLTGGVAALTDAVAEGGTEALGMSELAETSFGVGAEWSSFIIEPAVSRLLAAGNCVLDDETWDTLPEINRRAVETAAAELGMTVEELRARIRFAVGEEYPTEGSETVHELAENREKTWEGQAETIISEAAHAEPNSSSVGSNEEQKSMRSMEIMRMMERMSERMDRLEKENEQLRKGNYRKKN